MLWEHCIVVFTAGSFFVHTLFLCSWECLSTTRCGSLRSSGLLWTGAFGKAVTLTCLRGDRRPGALSPTCSSTLGESEAASISRTASLKESDFFPLQTCFSKKIQKRLIRRVSAQIRNSVWIKSYNSYFFFWHISCFTSCFRSVEHIVGNLLMQLLLGVPLELVHKGFEVGMVYMSGVLAGKPQLSPFDSVLLASGIQQLILSWRSFPPVWVLLPAQTVLFTYLFLRSGSLASSIFDPLSALVGASGGVYALLGGYFMNAVVVSLCTNPVKLVTVVSFKVNKHNKCSVCCQHSIYRINWTHAGALVDTFYFH